MNIVLIGPRGSGKTAVGRALAERLGRPLLDTDEEVERKAGKSIRDIFEQDGEGRFRDVEAEVVREAARRDGIVIATGGGVVLRRENVEALRRNGFLVHLDAPPDTLAGRVMQDAATRARRPPLLPGLDEEEEIRRVMEARAPLYAAARHLRLDTSCASPEEVAGTIIREMRKFEAAAASGPGT
ncbi:MAG: shikimate kinase [Planctomycetota bacterium]|nr:shikimate kinase [Planctomycetota bacterium]